MAVMLSPRGHSGTIILNCMLLIIIWYFFHNYFWPWPQPPEIGLGLGLKVLASFNITAQW